MDESTDVAGLAILLVIVRYPYESSFEEDMPMCSPLPTNTTGEEICNKINIFFEENNLSWNDCIDICTDGVKAMTGLISEEGNRNQNSRQVEMNNEDQRQDHDGQDVVSRYERCRDPFYVHTVVTEEENFPQ
ncbi:Zinc finger BED domain-containing protein 5 [Eumeta japonica]|uniref:Zinc finger BED domain-containing protein 5 n=1 Tax=Eumeta variegata TaxID=151549 RepID=A0A4C1TSQ6_EUMVA|nr:Zinc finger BED domain-containing protein 5 [Eumeta japonica]